MSKIELILGLIAALILAAGYTITYLMENSYAIL